MVKFDGRGQEEFKRDPQNAIVEAASARFRPILLTTATTSLGLIPLWLGGGLMWEPMAIGIIFGLLFATVLTLVFVPILYKTFFKISFTDYEEGKVKEVEEVEEKEEKKEFPDKGDLGGTIVEI